MAGPKSYEPIAVSPIGSTADSPLRSYTSHGNGLSPNYGLPGQSYETGGALKSMLPGSEVLRGLGLTKDASEFTRKLYQRGIGSFGGDNTLGVSSGNYTSLNSSLSIYNLSKQLGLYNSN